MTIRTDQKKQPGMIDQRRFIEELDRTIPKDWEIVVGGGHYFSIAMTHLRGRAAERYPEALRRRIRRYIWLEGVAKATACLGAAFWLSLLIDRLWEPSRAVRGILLAGVGLLLLATMANVAGLELVEMFR